jgi:hypothetical protein
MKVTTYEGTIENGQIKLPEDVHLPENARVYVVIPEVAEAPVPRIRSPRLARQDQAADFVKTVVEDRGDAHLRR